MSLNHLEYNELNRYIYDLIKLVARLLSEWGGKLPPRVRIPLSPPVYTITR